MRHWAAQTPIPASISNAFVAAVNFASAFNKSVFVLASQAKSEFVRRARPYSAATTNEKVAAHGAISLVARHRRGTG
jgi:hypothetical protein